MPLDTRTALVVDERELLAHGAPQEAVALGQGKVLIPLTEENWTCIGEALGSNPDDAGELSYFMSAILRCAGFRSEFAGPVAFLEAEEGRESALVASGGAVIDAFRWDSSETDDPTERGAGPINAALRTLGVDCGEWPDEWTAIGLHALWVSHQ